jgi:hypothetical protein
MQAGGPFEVTWSKKGELLFREVVHGQTLDAAQVGAWLDLPRIAKMTGGDADTIELHDTATGQTIMEDVPQAGPESPLSIAFFLLSVLALVISLGWLMLYGSHETTSALAWVLVEVLLSAAGALFASYFGIKEAEKRARRRWPDATHITETQSHRTPGRPHLHRVVIGRLNVWRNLLWVLPMTAAGLGLFWFCLDTRLERGGFVIGDVLGMLSALSILVVPLHRLWLIAFQGAAAIWIEGGELVYLHRRFKRAPLWDIHQAAIGLYRDGENGMPTKHIIISGDNGRMGIALFSLTGAEDATREIKRLLRMPQLRYEETPHWLLHDAEF